MIGNRAALRYATALLSLSQDRGQVSTILGDMQRIVETLSVSADLRSVLRSPVVKTQDKVNVMHAVFAGVSKETSDLFDLLASNKRVALLSQVAQGFIDYIAKLKGSRPPRLPSRHHLQRH